MNKILSKIVGLLVVGWCDVAISVVGNDEAYAPINNPGSASTAESFNFEVFESTSQTKFKLPSCAENPPELGQCTPYICRVKAPFGEISVKVKGMEYGKCQYIERTFGMDGINCQFKKDDLEGLNRLFARRFQKLSGKGISLNKQEYEKLAEIFKNECTIEPDYNSTKLIPLNKINSGDVDPEFKIEELAKYSTITQQKAQIIKPKEMKDQEYKATLDNYRSIMNKPGS